LAALRLLSLKMEKFNWERGRVSILPILTVPATERYFWSLYLP